MSFVSSTETAPTSVGAESAAPNPLLDVQDTRRIRDVMGAFPSGVTVITTHGTSGPVGFTCQSFTSVSLDPPLVSFSIARTSQSLPSVQTHGRVVINFLSADQQHLSAQFARSGSDKWQGVEWAGAPETDAPLIAGVTGWVTGDIEREIEAGDHLIFLVRVRALSTELEKEPLVFHRGAYRELDYQI